VAPRRGFEPRTLRSAVDDLSYIFALFKQHSNLIRDFEDWVSNRVSRETAARYIKKVRAFLSAESTPQKDNKMDVLALRVLARFLYENTLLSFEEYQKIKMKYKLKQSKPRLEFYSDEEIRDLVVYYQKNKKKKYWLLLMFAVYSGLRRKHLVEFFNTFDQSKIVDIGHDCARYELNIFNNNKKAFFVYAPKELFDELKNLDDGVINYNNLTKKMSNVKFNKIRKWFYTIAVDTGVNERIIDFIQGRSEEHLGTKFYLHKMKLADKTYPRIKAEIDKKVKDKRVTQKQKPNKP